MNMPAKFGAPLRMLMSVDAVGGVWRYALDLAEGLGRQGIETVFVGFGPRPSADQVSEAEALGSLRWLDAPLDWTVENKDDLRPVPDLIETLAAREGVDIIHLNLPSQAAALQTELPVVVVSHSCVATWFDAVRGQPVPPQWCWQIDLNRQGFMRANAVLAPSRSHAAMLGKVYGPLDGLEVVGNASRVPARFVEKQAYVFAAGRWWDEGKNGAALDAAAAQVDWPVMMAGADTGPNGQHLPLHNVDYRGALPHCDAMNAMAKAAITVSPSIYEPFGLAALEAARSGGALVLADIATYRELWDGAALFADPRDPIALAAAINRLSRDGTLRQRLGESALERSRAFTVETQSRRVAGLYRRLLAQHPVLSVAEPS